MRDFHVLTLESAFVVRTFFFVIFGMYITLGSILDPMVAVISLAIVGCLFVVRFIVLKSVVRRRISPQLYIAPRGLITVLLFFVISSHSEFVIEGFNAGILLFVILITSVVMTIALISYRGENVREVLLSPLPKLKEEKEGTEEIIDHNVEEQNFNPFS